MQCCQCGEMWFKCDEHPPDCGPKCAHLTNLSLCTFLPARSRQLLEISSFPFLSYTADFAKGTLRRDLLFEGEKMLQHKGINMYHCEPINYRTGKYFSEYNTPPDTLQCSHNHSIPPGQDKLLRYHATRDSATNAMCTRVTLAVFL